MVVLRDKLKCEIEEKYKIDFAELEIISKSIKDKYFIDETLKLLFNIYIVNNNKEEYISEQCLKRFKIIKEKEYSYVINQELYKEVENAYELWYLLYNIMSLEILWNKEITHNYDKDYQFLNKLAQIYLKETENIIKK